jgi:hypothetical protein
MMAVDVNADVKSRPWVDLRGQLPDAPGARIERIGRVPEAMTSGGSAVVIIARTSDDKLVLLETSMALFLAAAKVFQIHEDKK